MKDEAREKANSFDRILRQRTINHLENAAKHILRLMDAAYDVPLQKTLIKRMDTQRNSIIQITSEVKHGSFLSLPAFRSGRRLHLTAPTRAEEEIPNLLLVGELLLLECRNLFERIQALERIKPASDEVALVESIAGTEDSVRQIEQLQQSRSNPGGPSLESIVSQYNENVEELENLAERENLFALEKSQLSGMIPMNKGSIFNRFISTVKRKPVFEKEIGDIILLLGEKLRTKTGGLVKLPALYAMVKASKPTMEINVKDIEKVVQGLEKKGLIPGLRKMAGQEIVELVPLTATPDMNTILELASKKGHLNIEDVLFSTKWTHERATRAMKQMEEVRLAKYDLTSNEWSFPGLSQEFKVETDK